MVQLLKHTQTLHSFFCNQPSFPRFLHQTTQNKIFEGFCRFFTGQMLIQLLNKGVKEMKVSIDPQQRKITHWPLFLTHQMTSDRRVLYIACLILHHVSKTSHLWLAITLTYMKAF